jgi:rhamnose transport system ATP-binding protein
MRAIVDLKSVSKRFGPVEVLANVSLSLMAGEVHALAGANGAGKSTVVKLLAGIYQPDNGQVFVDGVETRIANAADARRKGIAVIHQHPELFPDLTVAENIFAGWQPRRWGCVDWSSLRAKAQSLLSRLGMDIDVHARVKSLSVAERQAVAMAAALSADARVLIMDEPTSAISGRELERFFQIVDRLKSEGVAILFITHFLDEIFAISDYVTVLRSGRYVIGAPAAELTPNTLVSHMIGAAPGALFPKETAANGKKVLSVSCLRGDDCVEDVSFDLRSGEILGFFGLVGAGRSEIAETLFGMRQPIGGEILIDGTPAEIANPRDAMKLGISLVPEDRHLQGLVLPFTNRANESLAILDKISRAFGLIDARSETQLADKYSRQLGVVATGVEQVTGTLSGGNQQKVLLAKWLAPGPRILILDQPTRGVDVAAKADIYRIISGLASAGMAIILIGDDPDEVIGMSDRVLVFREGRMVAEFADANLDREKILLAATHVDRSVDSDAA